MCSRSNVEGLQYSIASYEPIPYDKDGVIYWTYLNLCKDIGETDTVNIMNAASKLLDHELYPLRHKHTRDVDKAYFKLCFVDADGRVRNPERGIDMESPFDFNDPLNKDVIAVFYPKYDGYFSGWGFFNDQKFFSLVDDGRGILLINSIVHEWMHGMGLGHTKREDDIMYEYYGVDRRITSDTRNALADLYMDQRVSMLMKVPSSRMLVKELKSRSILRERRPCDFLKKLTG